VRTGPAAEHDVAGVPLARRNLTAEPRRLFGSAIGVGLAVMLILLLDGLWAGIRAGASSYEDNVGADLCLAQQGTTSFYGASSRIPIAVLDELRADPAVDWAAPVRSFYAVLELHDKKVPVAVIGSLPGEAGGPWRLYSGRAPAGDDEVVVGRVLARRHGIEVGDTLDAAGRTFTVVGTGSDAFMTSYVFVTHAVTDALLASPATTAFALVGTDDPAGVRERFQDRYAVLDPVTLARADFDVIARAFQSPMRLMAGVAFVIGSAVIALTAYTGIAERRREYGIVKALGATARYLVRLALVQSAIVAGVGLVAGALLFVAARAAITTARPQFSVVLTAGSVARVLLAVAVMAVVGAVVPARRLVAVDPATAYRGG
jgi:putative ABC transport system permease protein